MNKENLQYKQELDVFLSLCPLSLQNKVFPKGSLSYHDYINCARMFKALGFSEFAEVYILSDYEKLRKKSHALTNCKEPDREVFDERPLVKEFVLNIHSPVIRAMFIKRINEYYNEKTFNES